MRTVSLYSYDQFHTCCCGILCFGEDGCDFGDCDGSGDSQMEKGDSAFATEGRYFSHGKRAAALPSFPEKNGNHRMVDGGVYVGCVS